MSYDRNHFITRFTAIPDERWRIGDRWSPHPDVPHCALGHCSYDEGAALVNLLACSVALINDGLDPRYQQPTPRARVLAALRDLP